MEEDLTFVFEALSQNFNELLRAYQTAQQNSQTNQLPIIQNRIQEVARKQSNIQLQLNQGAIDSLNSIADSLEEEIEAQQAMGFRTAVNSLIGALERIRPDSPVLPATPVNPDPASASKQTIVDLVFAYAGEMGFEAQTALCIIAIESDFNASARSTLSSAGGLFQFLDDTWRAAGGEEFPNTGGDGNGYASHAKVGDQIRIGIHHLKDIQARLIAQDSNFSTPTHIYMAHQQGFSGATSILKGDVDVDIASAISQEAARNNGLNGLTIGQAIEKFELLVSAHMEEVNPLAPSGQLTLAGHTAAGPAIVTTGSAKRPIALRAAEMAKSEMNRFAFVNGARVLEVRDPLLTRGAQYFDFVNRVPNDIVGDGNPWSAAFISFVFGRAGMTKSIFPFAANHASYILKSVKNLDVINSLNGGDVPEEVRALKYCELNDHKPRVGDLIGDGRSKSKLIERRVRNTADIRLHLPNIHFPSHTDVITEVNKNTITTIGGNVGDSIRTKTFNLDGNGKVSPGQGAFFFLAVNV